MKRSASRSLARRWQKVWLAGLPLVLALCSTACSKSNELDRPEPLQDASAGEQEGGEAGDGGESRLPSFPRTGINSTTLTVTGIEPRTGPFQGGNVAIVRGSGFDENAIVRVGGRMVQLADTRMLDRNSLRVVVPAGEVGPADVEVEIAGEVEVREAAYAYNALAVEPTAGSTAGGTAVEVTASEAVFDERVVIEFGGAACSELKVVTPNLVRCKTPRGRVGGVDVVARWPDSQASASPDTLTATRAFEYVDFTDTNAGGLSGGPIAGTVNVTVIDSVAGFVVPGVFVLLGSELDTPHQGHTDTRGQITFSGDDLSGPLTVHVARECFESASIVEFDAQNVTVHVTPLRDPSCAMLGDPPVGGGRGTAGSLISGELVFPGSDEFAVNSWDVVPPPRDDEVRVTYVFTTRVRAPVPNPPPSVTGTVARIVEQTSPIGVRGYPYRIFARPAGLAVYALSGLERRDTREFTPYVMGVARDVITAPGDETEGVDIGMDIPLDRELQVELAELPQPSARGPDQFRVAANLDLGGEGVIVRQVNGRSIDLLTQFNSGNVFRFFAQPPLIGSLSDARYEVVAGFYTGDSNAAPPYTEVRQRGVSQPVEPVRVGGFLDIPRGTVPAAGERIPADRVLRWTMQEPAPDLYLVTILGGNGVPAWSQIVPGTRTETPIPDLSSVEGVTDIAPGVVYWSVRAIRVDGFVYDEFKYDALSSRLWSHTSVDSFTMLR